MKVIKIAVSLFILVALLVAWFAPIGPLPGIRIGGTPTEVPAQWQDTSGIHEIRLEAPGTIPRVVIIWVVQVDGVLHVVGSDDSGWTQMLGAQSTVRVRIEEQTYTLMAKRVTKNYEKIVTAYGDKYRPNYPDIVAGFPSLEETASSTAVFRLE